MLVEAQRNRGVVRRVTGLARSTPGRLSLVALLLIVASLLVGALTAVAVQRRSAALEVLADRSEPLAFAAQEVYRSMADADATAASAFLSGGVESADLRRRYEADVAKAAAALSTATGEITRSPELSTALSTLSGQLPVYTGLVETARAHNRQGNPVGAAYLREASDLMRSRLLPAAQELYRVETRNVVRDLEDAGAWPWLEALLGTLLLAALVMAQRYLTRRTNRVFNVGLVAASVACVVSLLWVLVASLVVVSDASAGKDGAAAVDVLARARIATLTARGNEMLTLVSRGSGTLYEKRYAEVSGELKGLLDQAGHQPPTSAVRQAGDHYEQWQQAHAKVREADEKGEYTTAVGLALGSDAGGAAVAFDKLGADLVEALGRSRAELTDTIAGARGALSGAVPVVVLLALLTAAASTAGLWQRLKEYR
ncbi:hypothetical protein FHS29_000089 [Saccharothrix tamanrassetensis]|uniref:Secreted protein n=1 Tax=Saccharothrix tamanrassetensis TaxID=1051531 RepID=A0A841C7Y5_9PSEU|nr:hypothetical protein [Saccharothrix tamanrassetensis]MBB5953519.1 hypothetical protein [Saccharothrix tamanrassetensis]